MCGVVERGVFAWFGRLDSSCIFLVERAGRREGRERSAGKSEGGVRAHFGPLVPLPIGYVAFSVSIPVSPRPALATARPGDALFPLLFQRGARGPFRSRRQQTCLRARTAVPHPSQIFSLFWKKESATYFSLLFRRFFVLNSVWYLFFSKPTHPPIDRSIDPTCRWTAIVERSIAMPGVLLYSKTYCSFCAKLKALLRDLRIPFRTEVGHFFGTLEQGRGGAGGKRKETLNCTSAVNSALGHHYHRAPG